MTRQRVPDAILAAAHARARARSERDWPEADRLRQQIEDAGWRIVDRGTDFALSPAAPPDVVDGDRIRYGSSASVPSRSEVPPTGVATVVVIATDEPDALGRTLAGLGATSPAGTSVVIVADAPSAEMDAALDAIEGAMAEDGQRLPTEVVRTASPLGRAAAINIGLRRATGPVVIVLDPGVEVGGDVVSPIVRALDDPTVAVAGGWGTTTRDLRTFEDGPPGDVDAIEGSPMAFRRADGAERGPLDERFRVERLLDVWWSLTLRDGGETGPPRRAVRVAGLPIGGVGHRDAADARDPGRAQPAKRDFYRVLDRFGSRRDLLRGPD